MFYIVMFFKITVVSMQIEAGRVGDRRPGILLLLRVMRGDVL
jgi:hypothetical protein